MNISEINLKSRYIPVCNSGMIKGETSWLDKSSPFYYPYALINLMQFKDNREMNGINKDIFLLSDSGGFQVITGTCDYDWKQSLQQQLMIGSNRIFSFDKPPLVKKWGGSNAAFNAMNDSKSRELILLNFETALKQSQYLKENNPDRIKDFFYVVHGSSKELLDYNIELINKMIGGIDNFNKYFGGVCYSVKGEDSIFLTSAMLHAKQYFIKRGFPVHVLGFGSFIRMVLMVRCEITTFDATSAITGQTYWTFYNSMNLYGKTKHITFLTKNYWPFKSQFCDCPVCSKVDFKQLIKEEKYTEVGRYISLHNLYQIIKFNVFLDSIEKSEYTKVVDEFLDLSDDIKLCLEYIDYSDANGFEIAYDKYKHYLKKDGTKQGTLF
jgi:tRNA-guanine family transglycosylase